MGYDETYFDEVIERRGTIAGKWDGLEFLYGESNLIPMWVADTDFRVPKEVIEAFTKRAKHGIFGYGLYGFSYTDSPIDWHLKRNKINYKKDSIFFTPNVLVSLNNVIRALTEEGDTVLVISPTYGPLKKEPLATNRKVITSRLVKEEDRFKVNFDDFERLAKEEEIRLFILCSPHNPTGRVWTEEELAKMVSICQRYQIPIIADEIHSDLIMPGYHFTPTIEVARKLAYEQQVVMLCSPTKTFNMAGLQVSYYITENKSFIEQINQVKRYSHTSDLLNSFAYLGLTKAYEHGAEYVDALTEYIYANYQYLKTELATHCPFAEVTKLEATYLVWIDVSSLSLTNQELRAKMVESGVAIQTGDDFFQEEGLFFRVNIACPRSLLEKGVKAIVKCLQGLE